jgi:hypothetical protein
MTSNRLPVLAGEIEAEHLACSKAAADAVHHAIEAGRGLLEAKELVPRGEWETWLRANVPTITVRTCQRYMRVARMVGESDTVSFSSMRALLAPDRPKASPWWEELAPERRVEHWRLYPADFGAVVRYLDADGLSHREISAAIGAPLERVRVWLGGPPRLVPTGGDAEAILAPAVDAATRFHWSGGSAWNAMQAGLWARLYERPDLQRRLANAEQQLRDEADAAWKEQHQRAASLASEVWQVGRDLCREAWGLQPAPKEPSLWSRVVRERALLLAIGEPPPSHEARTEIGKLGRAVQVAGHLAWQQAMAAVAQDAERAPAE